jgi:5-formyltetrahydrofolate cyclo-ligase
MADDVMLSRLREHAKRELRARMGAVRRVLPVAACAQRAERATARVLQLPEFEQARTVVGYSAVRKELDPSNLLMAAAKAGKRVGLPRVQDDRLELRVFRAGDALEESGLGILEPLASAPLIEHREVDLIVVPGLAFDTRGHRIGYGSAFYDRLLPHLSRAFRVGFVYDFQLVPELPNSAHDVAVHCVVSDAHTLRVAEAGG